MAIAAQSSVAKCKHRTQSSNYSRIKNLRSMGTRRRRRRTLVHATQAWKFEAESCSIMHRDEKFPGIVASNMHDAVRRTFHDIFGVRRPLGRRVCIHSAVSEIFEFHVWNPLKSSRHLLRSPDFPLVDHCRC